MTKKGVFISGDYQDSVKFDQNDIIRINPHKFLDAVKTDLDNYIDELRNNANARSVFDGMFSLS